MENKHISIITHFAKTVSEFLNVCQKEKITAECYVRDSHFEIEFDASNLKKILETAESYGYESIKNLITDHIVKMIS